MARSNRRRRRSSVSSANPRSYSEYRRRRGDLPSESSDTESSGAATRTADAPLRGANSVNWQGEYAEVFADLRNLLIITGLLFVTMVVLGFLL